MQPGSEPGMALWGVGLTSKGVLHQTALVVIRSQIGFLKLPKIIYYRDGWPDERISYHQSTINQKINELISGQK